MVEPSTQQVAEFQRALVELLAQNLPLDEVLQRLRATPAFVPFASYVLGFDPRMVEVAALLVKKWGRGATQGRMTAEQ